MQKVTYQDDAGTYEITLEHPVVTLTDVLDFLIKPVLIAAGYSPVNVDELVGERDV